MKEKLAQEEKRLTIVSAELSKVKKDCALFKDKYKEYKTKYQDAEKLMIKSGNEIDSLK